MVYMYMIYAYMMYAYMMYEYVHMYMCGTCVVYVYVTNY